VFNDADGFGGLSVYDTRHQQGNGRGKRPDPDKE
jgi:hypothetical protein